MRFLPILLLAAVIGHPATAEVPAMGHTDGLVIETVVPKTSRHLHVSSPAFKDQADIPFENTQYRGNRFPGLRWNKGPDGTKSYAVIMQSAPDRATAKSSIHLVMFNIPASVRCLPSGMTTPPRGALLGPNVHGLNQPYAGPHTHTLSRQAYHLQVFALDIVLPKDTDQDFETIAADIIRHTLAAGDLVGYATMDPQSTEAK